MKENLNKGTIFQSFNEENLAKLDHNICEINNDNDNYDNYDNDNINNIKENNSKNGSKTPVQKDSIDSKNTEFTFSGFATKKNNQDHILTSASFGHGQINEIINSETNGVNESCETPSTPTKIKKEKSEEIKFVDITDISNNRKFSKVDAQHLKRFDQEGNIGNKVQNVNLESRTVLEFKSSDSISHNSEESLTNVDRYKINSIDSEHYKNLTRNSLSSGNLEKVGNNSTQSPAKDPKPFKLLSKSQAEVPSNSKQHFPLKLRNTMPVEMNTFSSMRDNNFIVTKQVGMVEKLTNYKEGSASKLWNIYNNFKHKLDQRLLILNQDYKQLLFMNKDKETKKIPFESIISIKVCPRGQKYDIIIDTHTDVVYLNVLNEEGQWNIDSALGWQVALKDCGMGDKLQYDTQKQKEIGMEEITVYKWADEQVFQLMKIRADEREKVISQVSEKVFDQFKINDKLDLTQFTKCIRCISNDIFREKEIVFLYNNILKENNRHCIVDKDFFKISDKIITNIVEKKYRNARGIDDYHHKQ